MAPFAERSPITGAAADMYQYDIVLDHGGTRSQVVVTQTAVPHNLRPLVEWLEKRASGRGD
ncbi:MAG: protealysin inhibitor emfourin [Pseudonocardiaceae bacterium]